MIWCDEAVAYELVPNERLNTAWVCRRSFRGGQCYARVFVDRYRTLKKYFWFVKKSMQLLGGLLILPFLRIVSYTVYVRMLDRVFAACGQLTGLLGDAYQHKEYASRHYHEQSEFRIENN
jgi:succinoglycan biosynthesis protein ExoM